MDDSTQLHRQVHPNFIQDGRITSQVFIPTSKDKGLLSTYNGDQFSPEKSHDHYTSELELESAGVVSVSFGECSDLDLEIIEDDKLFEGHCSIDFTQESKNQTKKKGKLLSKKAKERGWQYRGN